MNAATFEFLRDLSKDNTREWFNENKERYENDVKAPLLRFVEDFDERLESLSPHFVADPRPVGGSMFRIYRDVRFSKDKTPFKTNAGLQFRPEAGKNAHAPGLYMHIEPGQAFGGGGIWHPDAATLGKIRGAIVDQSSEWESVTTDPELLNRHELGGSSLKRPPRGYDPDHPFIDDLKKKDHFASARYTEKEVSSPDFIDQFTADCFSIEPYLRFLTEAADFPF
jgi:uncharacterized protein (TIGR02453 family)